MSLPTRKLSHWLGAYDQYTAASEAPQALHFWTGVATIAGALRRRVWIEQRYFQWTPNFYIVFVGPPGVITKSTSVRIGTSLLRQVPGVHIGPNSLTWQMLAKSLMEAQELVKWTGHEMEDGSPLFLPMACLTCSINELGTFLRPDEPKLIDVFTDLWDGQKESWEHGTVTQGSTKIENPWLNIIAATTPAWLQQNFPESMIGGGLASRMLFIYADVKRHKIAYPGLVTVDENFEKMEKDLVHDLQIIAQLIGEYVLTTDAVAWGIDWYQQHWDNTPQHLQGDRFGGYIARKQTHIHKLAMVLAAAQRNELVIEKDDLIQANNMVTALEFDMKKVFESIGSAQSGRQAQEVFAYILASKGIEQSELWTRVMNIMSQQHFKEACDGLIKAGRVEMLNVRREDGTRELVYRPTKKPKKKG